MTVARFTRQMDVMEELFVHVFAREKHSDCASKRLTCVAPSIPHPDCENIVRTSGSSDGRKCDISATDMVDLMISMLRRCSMDALSHLEAATESTYSPANSVSVRILAVLQVHLLAIASSLVSRHSRQANTNNRGDQYDEGRQPAAADAICSCALESLLAYMDALTSEAIVVLKKLHKASCHHEEIVTWRLNGSFFQRLLPTAIEALCVLVSVATSASVDLDPRMPTYAPVASLGLLLVQRLLPHFVPMLKLLDEVNWKMRDATDENNQTMHNTDDRTAHSWVLELQDACGVLCGKLACVLVLYHTECPSSSAPAPVSLVAKVAPEVASILEWERTSVFEIEDEIERSEDVNPDDARNPLAWESVEEKRNVGSALFRVGLCFFHDLLRKLTISSSKYFLLEEFIRAMTSMRERQSRTRYRSERASTTVASATLQAIENLYIRLAKLVSADDSSLDLKEKALVAWSIPIAQLGASPDAAASVVAKAGIVSIFADVLVNDHDVVESSHIGLDGSEAIATEPPRDTPAELTTSPPLSEVVSTFIRSCRTPILRSQSTPESLNEVAWVALCVVALQLCRSSSALSRTSCPLFAPAPVLAAARSSSTKDLLTSRPALSPRKRLTLPKRIVVSTVLDSIERVYELLFTLLASVNQELTLGATPRLVIEIENILQLLCQLHRFDEQRQNPSDLASSQDATSSVSARWVEQLIELLVVLPDDSLAQIYLRELLAETLPQLPPGLHAAISLPRLCRSLFRHTGCRRSSRSADEPSSSALILASGIRLVQRLWASSYWTNPLESLLVEAASYQRLVPQSQRLCSDDEAPGYWQLVATCFALGGYSETVVNENTARYSEGSSFGLCVPTRMERSFSSPMPATDIIKDSTAAETLVLGLIRQWVASPLEMPGHEAPAASSALHQGRDSALRLVAIDKRMATLIHLRASVLRFMMATASSVDGQPLLWLRVDVRDPASEHQPEHPHTVIDHVFWLASSSGREFVVSALGPDHKKAMRGRSVRWLLETVGIVYDKTPHTSGSCPSLTQLEELAWDAWSLVGECDGDSVSDESFWWQEKPSERPSALEVMGGDVEIRCLTVKALEHFPTVRLSSVAIAANTGLWFYEVTVLTDGLMQIGYIDADFAADPVQGQGVGDHTTSWGFDGFRCKKWNVNSTEYGVAWRANDIVGVLLDTDRMELSYFLNGRFLGVAFADLPMSASSRMCPAASLNVHQAAQFNFGSPDSEQFGFAHAPTLDSEQDQSRFQPVAAAMAALSLQSKATNRPLAPTEHGSVGKDGSDFVVQHLTDSEDDGGDDAAELDMDEDDDAVTKGTAEPTETTETASNDTITFQDSPCGFHSTNRLRASAAFRPEPAIPLSVTLDSLLAVMYARHTLVEILSSTQQTKSTLALVSGWCAQPETSRRLVRFLRVSLGFEKNETLADAGYVAIVPSVSRRPLLLQRTFRALLKMEIERFRTNTQECEAKRTESPLAARQLPIFHALFAEMHEQLLLLEKPGYKNKKARRGVAAANAFWIVWLTEVVLAEVEAQFQLQPVSQADSNLAFKRVVAGTCYSLSFFEVLTTLAFSASSDRAHSTFVAFKLMRRVLDGVRKLDQTRALEPLNPSQLAESNVDCERKVSERLEAFNRAAQMHRALELFSVRYRKEIASRVFGSDWVVAVFELLVSHWESIRAGQQSKGDDALDCLNADSDKGASSIELCIEMFSSTRATISWCERLEARDPSTEAESVGETSVLFLNVFQRPDDGFQSDGHTTAVPVGSTQVLPSKGSYTIRNLMPDTRYAFRLSPTATTTDSTTAPMYEESSLAGQDSAVAPQASEGSAAPDSLTTQPTRFHDAACALLVLQTPPAPVFQLDGDAMGKNLVVFNRSLSVKNLVNKKWHTVRAAVGFDEGVHQWHVRIDTCVSKNIFIGVCTLRASLNNYVGSDGFGYGFLANKAVWHNKSKLHPYGEIFKQGDVLEVTLDCNAKTLAFSHNGEYLGVAATNLHAVGVNGAGEACKWYPALSLYNKDDQLTIIPPSNVSTPSLGQPHVVAERSQNASVLRLLEAMEHVKAYERGDTASAASPASWTRLYHAAYVDYKAWRDRELVVREVELGRLIRIDSSATATCHFGLAIGDSVLTTRGYATVLGVHNHELWYECETDNPGDTSALSSWSLHACKQMLASPSEFPVHRPAHGDYNNRQHKTEPSPVADDGDDSEHQNDDDVSFVAFARDQANWAGLNAWEAFDAMLVELLDSIAASRAVSGPHSLSYADVSAELILGGDSVRLLLVRLRETLDAAGERSERTIRSLVLARMGLLLFVNRSLYSITRLVVGEPLRTAVLPQGLLSASMSNNKIQRNSLDGDDEVSAADSNTFATEPSAVFGSDSLAVYAAMLSLSRGDHLALPNDTSGLVRRMLFKAQKARLVAEALHQTATPTLNAPERDPPSESTDFGALDDDGDPSDLPRVRVRYPEPPCRPFWSLKASQRSPHWTRRADVPKQSRSESLFAQVSQQLVRMSPRDWRRSYATSFEPLAITRAFHVSVTTASELAACDAVADRIVKGSSSVTTFGALDLVGGAKAFGGDEQVAGYDGSIRQPPPPLAFASTATVAVRTQPYHQLSQNQATQYARLLEELLCEVQSPVFPLLVPVRRSLGSSGAIDSDSMSVATRLDGSSEPRDERCTTEKGADEEELVLDVNTSLLAPEAIARASVTPDQVLRWFFHFGQLLGLAWRGSVLLPLQFVSSEFWRDVVAEPTGDGSALRHRLATRGTEESDTWLAIFQAIRDGLFAVVPIRCVSLLTPLEVRSRLADPHDVTALETLQVHAEYDSELRHHAVFWELIACFTAVERHALMLFLTNTAGRGRRSSRRSNSASRSGRLSSAATSEAAAGPFVLEISGDALADSQSHPDACYPVVVAITEQRCRLHLPAYSSMEAMRKKLILAMTTSSSCSM